MPFDSVQGDFIFLVWKLIIVKYLTVDQTLKIDLDLRPHIDLEMTFKGQMSKLTDLEGLFSN